MSIDKHLVLEICMVDRQAMFVCGSWGWITKEVIVDIEKALNEADDVEHGFLKGLPQDTVEVLVSAKYEPDEMDHSIVPPRVANEGYWDFKLLRVMERMNER